MANVSFKTKDGKTVRFQGKTKKARKGPPPKVGFTKRVRAPGGCTQALRYTGRGKTGWAFVKGTRSCPAGGGKKSGKKRGKGRK